MIDGKKIRYSSFVNVAVTDLTSVILTAQSPVPLHPSPLQPVKLEPVSATAVRVTAVL